MYMGIFIDVVIFHLTQRLGTGYKQYIQYSIQPIINFTNIINCGKFSISTLMIMISR